MVKKTSPAPEKIPPIERAGRPGPARVPGENPPDAREKIGADFFEKSRRAGRNPAENSPTPDEIFARLGVETLAFFAAVGAPVLTRDELWARVHGRSRDGEIFWPKNADPAEFFAAVRADPRVAAGPGDFFCLAGTPREKIWERLDRERISRAKWTKTLAAVRPLAGSPGARIFLASGSLSARRAGPDSDLDIFTIADPEKIWTARGAAGLRAAARGTRRSGRRERDRLCFNHFLTAGSPLGPRNFYTAHLYAGLVPVAGDWENWQKLRAENLWIRDFLPNAGWGADPGPEPAGFFETAPGFFSGKFFPAVPRRSFFPEIFWEKIQMFFRRGKLFAGEIFGKNLAGAARGAGTGRVKISPEELCFHEVPQEPRVLAAWTERLAALGLPGNSSK